MEKIKNIVIGIMLVVIIILMSINSCNRPVDSSNRGESLVTHDTTIKIVPARDTTYVFQTRYYPRWDTVKSVDSSKWNADLCKFERVYLDSLPDSNVTIFTDIRTIGILKSSQIKYKLKVPLRIETTIRTDSTYIKIVPNRWDVIGIGGIGGNNEKFNATLGAALRYKRAYYGYEYNFVDKTHNAKVGVILFKSRK